MQESTHPYTTTDLVGNRNKESQARRKLPISAEKLRKMVKAGEFPKPIKIGNRNYWRPACVDAWIESKEREAQEGSNDA